MASSCLPIIGDYFIIGLYKRLEVMRIIADDLTLGEHREINGPGGSANYRTLGKRGDHVGENGNDRQSSQGCQSNSNEGLEKRDLDLKGKSELVSVRVLGP